MGVGVAVGSGVGVGAGSGTVIDVAVEVGLGVGVGWSQATSATTVAQSNAARPNHALIGTPTQEKLKSFLASSLVYPEQIQRCNSACDSPQGRAHHRVELQSYSQSQEEKQARQQEQQHVSGGFDYRCHSCTLSYHPLHCSDRPSLRFIPWYRLRLRTPSLASPLSHCG